MEPIYRKKVYSMKRLGTGIAVFGAFGNKKNKLGGQTVKNQELYKFLKNNYSGEISIYDTDKFKKNKLKIFSIFSLLKNNDIIILTVSKKGYQYIFPFIFFLNYIYQRQICEIVIGGTRHEFVKRYRIYRWMSRHNKRIYVQSMKMCSEYTQMGFSNCRYLPSFKTLDPITEIDKKRFYSETLQVCTFSRVERSKGIEIAIEAIKMLNREGINIELVIYGPIDSNYEGTFCRIKNQFPHYISYGGVIHPLKTTAVLKKYAILLFPTYHDNEGFPSALIDGFSAGLPVIASKAGAIPEVITDGKQGLLLRETNAEDLAEKIRFLANNRDKLALMAEGSLKQYQNYCTERVLHDFLEDIEAT